MILIGIALDSQVKDRNTLGVLEITKVRALYMQIIVLIVCHSWTISLLDTRATVLDSLHL